MTRTDQVLAIPLDEFVRATLEHALTVVSLFEAASMAAIWRQHPERTRATFALIDFAPGQDLASYLRAVTVALASTGEA